MKRDWMQSTREIRIIHSHCLCRSSGVIPLCRRCMCVRVCERVRMRASVPQRDRVNLCKMRLFNVGVLIGGHGVPAARTNLGRTARRYAPFVNTPPRKRTARRGKRDRFHVTRQPPKYGPATSNDTKTRKGPTTNGEREWGRGGGGDRCLFGRNHGCTVELISVFGFRLGVLGWKSERVNRSSADLAGLLFVFLARSRQGLWNWFESVRWPRHGVNASIIRHTRTYRICEITETV